MHPKTLAIILCAPFLQVVAQEPGDNIFDPVKVVRVDLTFEQTGFWDSLVANYTSETYMLAAVDITDAADTWHFDSIGVRLKGNSSYGHPGNKKSFKIDFNRYVEDQEIDGLRKLNFNNCFKDPTFMREHIYYAVCADAGIPAPRANFANIYMNGTFWGFYTMVEQVDDEFLESRFGENDENLFKAGDAFEMGGTESADLMYYGETQDDYSGMYTLENNETENDWTDLITLLDFINNTSDTEFADGLSTHFDVPRLMMNFAMYNLFANLDSYINSARNYYLYDFDHTGYWEWIPWDSNEAFGLYTGGPGTGDLTELQPYYFTMSRPLLQRIVTITTTKEIYDYYYCSLYNAYFLTDFIDSLITDLYAVIQPHVYADYNKMFTNTQFEDNLNENITTGGMGGGTAYGLRSFISERVGYLSGILDCEAVHADIVDQTSGAMNIYPNPATDHIFIELPGEASTLIQLYHISGALILQTYTMHGSVEISVAELPAGVYLICTPENNGTGSSTFIKQ